MILDILFCTSLRRGSEQEVKFMTDLCQNHPELDSRAIDKVIADKMGELIVSLNFRYRNQLEFNWVVSGYTQQHGNGRNSDKEVFDLFLIRITPLNATQVVPV
jgi:hypothetical protein